MAEDNQKDRFVRWQSITIGQLTYAINLILTFSVATLGFQITLLFNDKFTPTSWHKCAFSLSMLLMAVSIGFGITCVINRLRDFRATETVARMEKDGKPDLEIDPHRKLYEKLGGRTWQLLWWQERLAPACSSRYWVFGQPLPKNSFEDLEVP
jgi:uncharacterized membrane protein YbhN (UPF0104 family)